LTDGTSPTPYHVTDVTSPNPYQVMDGTGMGSAYGSPLPFQVHFQEAHGLYRVNYSEYRDCHA